MSRAEALDVRRSAIAGSWYPGAAAPLKATVDSYLDNVDKIALSGDIVGIIAPHAGYTYSGQVAAYAYKQVYGKNIKRVVVLSPMHRMYMGRFAVTAKGYYETPLGLVKVDTDTLQELAHHVELTPVGQDNEHSLEIQLPFLQRLLAQFLLVPIMMGTQDLDSCQTLAKGLAQAITAKDTLLVASTDLSHFYSQRRARTLDQVFINDVEAYNPEKLARDLASGDTEACGGGPVITALLAAQRLGANRAQILKYATSGDVTGDYSSVVGYAAGVIWRSVEGV